MPFPSRINIGSGRDWREEAINIDINPALGPDLIADVSSPDLVGSEHVTGRFGPLVLAAGRFTHIRAAHVLEHVPDLVRTMTNCLALLGEGGEMEIEVPYDLSHGAWQDPTHVRAFNERSWIYYTDWHWMVGWNEWRFDVVHNALILSNFGQELKQRGVPNEQIRITPRAVDVNRAVLRKRRLTEEEQRRGRQQAQPRMARVVRASGAAPAEVPADAAARLSEIEVPD
ncbi:MAG: methyltransferase domain-containing protein [Alphaproteobacteria bacterium]